MHVLTDDACMQVRTRLAEGPGPKARKQLESLLQHAVRGITANPTATLEDLLVFVHGTLSHGLAQEARSVELSQAATSLGSPDDDQGKLCTVPSKSFTAHAPGLTFWAEALQVESSVKQPAM